MFRILLSFLAAIFIVGCGGSSGVATFKSATIDHLHGYDFSANKEGNITTADVYTVMWKTFGTYIDGESYDDGEHLWLGLYEYDRDGLVTYIYDAKETELSDIKDVDTTKWMKNTEANPSLIVGHTYVIKVLDGYVKFKVTEVHSADSIEDVYVKVDYEYSESVDFL